MFNTITGHVNGSIGQGMFCCLNSTAKTKHVDHVCVDRIRSGQMSIIKRLFPAIAMLIEFVLITEPPRGKTNNLHVRKQRRRSASR